MLKYLRSEDTPPTPREGSVRNHKITTFLKYLSPMVYGPYMYPPSLLAVRKVLRFKGPCSILRALPGDMRFKIGPMTQVRDP